jgi:hypothetical protein
VDPPRRLRDPEVEQPRHAVDPNDDVLRAHISVDDAERHAVLVPRFVGGMQTLECLDQDRKSDGNRDAFARSFGFEQSKTLSERKPLDVFHHEKDRGIVGDDVEHLHDVGMVDPRSEPGFVHEHRHKLGIGGERGLELLDGYRLRESEGAAGPTEVDRRDPS